jgi:hypothetical protein
MVTRPVSNLISPLTARTQLDRIIKRASEKGEWFVIGRPGDPKVVIMGIRDFFRRLTRPPEFLTDVWAESERKGTAKLTMKEIDAEIRAARREQHRKNASPKRRP